MSLKEIIAMKPWTQFLPFLLGRRSEFRRILSQLMLLEFIHGVQHGGRPFRVQGKPS